jgi:hypothetical protein
LLENNGNFSSDEKKVDGMSEILIKDEVRLYSFVFLQNVMLKSDEEEEGKLKIEEGINVENKEYLMKLEERVSFEKISFFSSSSSPFSFSLFSLVRGNISFKSCCFSDFSFQSFSLLSTSSSLSFFFFLSE